jgi:anaerobic selenocysteine-containing dehydrogenase
MTAPEPLVLVPRRQKRHLNSQLIFFGDRVEVLVHPDDAAAAGIGDGQPITVRNGLGSVTGIACLTTDIRPGTVSVPHGYPAANVNRLTDHADVDPLTGMTRYSGLPVSISAENCSSP